MPAFMRGYESHTHALLRIVVGLLFVFHGTQKLFDFPAPMGQEAPAFIIWVAGTIELVGGTLVMIGLLTRWAAFLCSGLMAAAYWMAHGSQGLYPILNHGELAILNCFIFLYIAAKGPGIWSVDAARGND